MKRTTRKKRATTMPIITRHTLRGLNRRRLFTLGINVLLELERRDMLHLSTMYLPSEANPRVELRHKGDMHRLLQRLLFPRTGIRSPHRLPHRTKEHMKTDRPYRGDSNPIDARSLEISASRSSRGSYRTS